jgi:hypothetical protein
MIDVFSVKRRADGVWVLVGETVEDLVSVQNLSGLEQLETDVERSDGSRQRVRLFRDRPDAGWVRAEDLGD